MDLYNKVKGYYERAKPYIDVGKSVYDVVKNPFNQSTTSVNALNAAFRELGHALTGGKKEDPWIQYHRYMSQLNAANHGKIWSVGEGRFVDPPSRRQHHVMSTPGRRI